MKKLRFILAVCLALALIAPASALAGPKIYWHFTFKAFVDLPDTSAVEWAWVTMVEIDRAAVFPDQARAARNMGGRFDGTWFAQIRGAAWRSDHRYFRDTKCHDRPAQKEIFWNEDQTESVYCAGQLYPSQPFRGTPGEPPATLDMFRLGFTPRRVLRENGRYDDLNAERSEVESAMRFGGGAGEEVKGSFSFQEVNYPDDMEHHRRCEKAWIEQYKTAFRHFNNQPLQEQIPRVGDYAFGQEPYGARDRNNIVWQAERSLSRVHPHWMRQEM